MNAILKINEASGKTREVELLPESSYSIGRAKENDIVLNDRRVSRKHAQIIGDRGKYKVIDGYFENGEIKRSINRVFVNGMPSFEQILAPGDVVTIGETTLEFRKAPDEKSFTRNAPEIGVGENDSAAS